METGTRARGLAGCARGYAPGDGVCGRRVATAKVSSAYTRMTTHSVNVGAQCASVRCAFLIASQLLEIELTRSQKTRKLFLIASFSAISAPARHGGPAPHHLTNHNPRIAPFLFDTNKPHKIIILTRALMKTKEKQFSIRYRFALRSIGLPAAGGKSCKSPRRACPLRSCIGALRSHSDQMRTGRIARRRQAYATAFLASIGTAMLLSSSEVPHERQ